jgi:hypothetical protein
MVLFARNERKTSPVQWLTQGNFFSPLPSGILFLQSLTISPCPGCIGSSHQVRTPAIQPHGSFCSQRVEDLTSPLADAGKLFLSSALRFYILQLLSYHRKRFGPSTCRIYLAPIGFYFYEVRTPAISQPHGPFGSQRVEDLTSPLADAGKLFLPLLLGIYAFFAPFMVSNTVYPPPHKHPPVRIRQKYA